MAGVVWAALGACGGVVEVAAPTGVEAEEPEVVLVWVGRGEAERFEEGAWVRDARFDYTFTVEQKRYGARWMSWKTMRRSHPDYDGSAGPREQVLWFAIDFRARRDMGDGGVGGEVRGVLRSRLGPGELVTDREFRRGELVIKPDISSHAPFDTYRIRQHYRYEDGLLDETVELVKQGDGPERVWVRNTERATLFVPGRFGSPPGFAPVAARQIGGAR